MTDDDLKREIQMTPDTEFESSAPSNGADQAFLGSVVQLLNTDPFDPEAVLVPIHDATIVVVKRAEALTPGS
jgi:hypothetical protein